MNASAYTIYNASAGSGKTFTLVKSFLKIILESPSPDTFKTLLAITFTNKAVNEMKERIISTLLIFSDKEKAFDNAMFQQIVQELGLSEQKVMERSYAVLQHILHNYAALSVTTIDGFNHRLIRSFAFDLHLNPNFEVFMEIDDLLEQAVDKLLQKTGENQQITQLLTDFSKDKISENKNWDITKELLEVAKLLTTENNYEYLQSLQKKTLEDFENLKKIIKNHQNYIQKNIDENVNKFFALVREKKLTKEDFNRGSVYNFFRNLRENITDPSLPFESVWATQLEDNPLYVKKLLKISPEKAAVLDEYHSVISLYFRCVEADLYQRKFYRNLLKNLIPLAVLSSIQQEIEAIKEQENILPISEFNNIINQTISGEPAPFIYERIGQRYRHYFIDEFQDTSALQWYNMLPLIGDALHSENHSKQRGSLLLVGDAKQSIYRWRGGKAEQFMDLYLQKKNPFFLEPEVADLDKNFRSYAQIIEFNNDFFQFIAQEKELFSTDLYKNLYRNAFQNTHSATKQGGYVSIEFLISEETEEEEKISAKELYSQAVLNAVSDALSCGFQQEDICVITRTNKQGVIVAQSLTQNGYKVISPEALLLKNIPEIQFLINLIKLSLYPENKSVFVELLFQYAEIKRIKNIHSFISGFIDNSVEEFFSTKDFSVRKFHQYSFYEGVAYAIERFELAKTSDAYLSHFLNLIFDFKNSKKGGIADFLLFWEDKKEKLSISAPAGIDAINVMTVHKSKGLEFPVVIYAFVNDKLVENKDKIWLSVSPEDFGGFEWLLVDNYKGLSGVRSDEVIQQQEQQLLDQLNVMYVAMTRPEAHLYIISEEKNSKKNDKIKSFSDILKRFLQEKRAWSDEKFYYEFGQKITPKLKERKPAQYIEFIQKQEQSSYKIVTRGGMLWDTQVQNAIEKGNIIHELLANIYTEEDIFSVLDKAWQSGVITKEQFPILQNQLQKIVNHPELQSYFSKNYVIFNEKEFINSLGEFERPDRVVFAPETSQAIVIDYKTGSFHPKYTTQLQEYAETLSALGWNVRQTFLVFINDEIEVLQVN